MVVKMKTQPTNDVLECSDVPVSPEALVAAVQWLRRRRVDGVQIRPQAGGGNVLEIPLSRPLRPGVLGRLASHKDREGLIEAAVLAGL